MPVGGSGPPQGPGDAARSADGADANTARTVSLNCRMLENPAANATSDIGRSVVSTRMRAVRARWARANATGPAPTSARRTRSSCRTLYPSREASPGTPDRSITPSAMSRMARPTTSARPSHSGEPGEASGRHRLHARNPERWAAAAVGRNRTLRRCGVRAGQLGRQ